MNYYFTLVLLVTALIPTYLIRFPIAGIPTNVFEVSVLALLIVGALIPDIRARFVERSKSIPKTLILFVILFLISAVVSTYISPHLETSLGILKGWIIVPLIFAWIVYVSTSEHSNKIDVLDALTFTGVVVSLFGFSQLGIHDRIFSIYDVPNSLALVLAPFITATTWKALYGASHSKRYYAIAAIIMTLALIFTKSVMGIVSVVVMLCVAHVIYQKSFRLRAQTIMLVGSVAILAVVILAPKVLYLLNPTSSAAVRIQLWSVSSDLIREHPFLGIGPGTFEPVYQEKLHQRFSEYEQGQRAHAPLPEFVFRDPHNWVVSFWLNTGFLGLISFIGIHVVQTYKTKEAVPYALALGCLLLFGLTDTIFWKNDLAAMHLALLASVLAINGFADSPQAEEVDQLQE